MTDTDTTPDRRIPGFLIILILVAILGGAAYLIWSNATGQPG